MAGVATTILIILFLVALLAVILGFVERYFARKGGGVVLPVMFFLMSVVSVISSLPSVIRTAVEHGMSGILQVIVMYLIVFLVLNLPTALTYIIYYRERRKLGDTPWPLNRKK